MTQVAVTYEKKPKREKIDNTQLVAEFRAAGGRILHVSFGGRGMTFAFKQKSNRIEFATALTHTVDTFTKKVGTKTAITHFLDGQTVFVPLGKRWRATALLEYFGELALGR